MNNLQSLSQRRWRALSHLPVVATLFTLLLGSLHASAQDSSTLDQNSATSGAVYTAGNLSTGNDVLHFQRAADGRLRFLQAFATGGSGNDLPLGSQGGVVLSEDGRWLLTVNPGSNNFSAFQVQSDGGLVLTDTEPSNGILPVSVTISRDLVYVVNAGDTESGGNIAGFKIDNQGALTPILGSIRALSGADDPQPAQIQFSPSGGALVVTEKATNYIDVFSVDASGVASEPVLSFSHGVTPFGFSFTSQGYLVASEAFAGLADISAVSSYSIDAQYLLHVVSPSVRTFETAACWVVTTRSGDFAYTTNTGSGTVSGFRINRQTGKLSRLNRDGITAVTGPSDSGPIDEALSRDNKYLYVLNSLTYEIIGLRVNNSDGSLDPFTRDGGLPTYAFGLAAR